MGSSDERRATSDERRSTVDERQGTSDAELEHITASRRAREEAALLRRTLRAVREALQASRERKWRPSSW